MNGVHVGRRSPRNGRHKKLRVARTMKANQQIFDRACSAQQAYHVAGHYFTVFVSGCCCCFGVRTLSSSSWAFVKKEYNTTPINRIATPPALNGTKMLRSSLLTGEQDGKHLYSITLEWLGNTRTPPTKPRTVRASDDIWGAVDQKGGYGCIKFGNTDI